MNVPLLLTASVISDVDLIMPGIEHRGPTHSIIILTLFLIPALTKYRKKGIPYYIALIQHTIIGDLLTGGQGVRLFWPIDTNWYGLGICMETLASVSLEWIFFIGCIAIMLKTKDAHILFQSYRSNLILIVPAAAVLLPTLFGVPLRIPPELIVSHLIYLIIFTVSILRDLIAILRKT